MEKIEIKKIEEYLYKKVSAIVDVLFQKLEQNDINVELERSQLNEKQLEAYKNIYQEYEDKLVQLKEETKSQIGYIENFDIIFALMIQNIVSKKQEL